MPHLCSNCRRDRTRERGRRQVAARSGPPDRAGGCQLPRPASRACPHRHSPGVPSSGRVSGVIATNERFESFIENNDKWFSDIELRAIDLEEELSEWRESRARELAESRPHRERERDAAEAAYRRERERDLAETRYLRGRQRGFTEPGAEREADEPAPIRTAAFRRAEGAGGHRHREFPRATGNTEHERNPGRTSAARTRPRSAAGRAWPTPDDDERPARDRTRDLSCHRPRTLPTVIVSAASAPGAAARSPSRRRSAWSCSSSAR